jgi:hypothetical protein
MLGLGLANHRWVDDIIVEKGRVIAVIKDSSSD